MKILTFDLEDWFHLLDNDETCDVSSWAGFESRMDRNSDFILDILKSRDHKATFFVLGWIAEKYPWIVKKIMADGHDIGTHSYAHQLVYNQSPVEFESDLVKSIEIIGNITGKNVESYRAPGFSIRETESWAFEILCRNGIKFDSSIFPAVRSHGGIRGFSYNQPVIIRTDAGFIYEFPLNYRKFLNQRFIFSGGGYFRLFPKKMVDYWFTKSEYLMTYFHPRDFDSQQPRLTLSASRHFKSYVGLIGARAKLDYILSRHQFVVIPEAFKLLNTGDVPSIDLTPHNSREIL